MSDRGISADIHFHADLCEARNEEIRSEKRKLSEKTLAFGKRLLFNVRNAGT
jgi:hypothetical protein